MLDRENTRRCTEATDTFYAGEQLPVHKLLDDARLYSIQMLRL